MLFIGCQQGGEIPDAGIRRHSNMFWANIIGLRQNAKCMIQIFWTEH